MDPVTKDFKFEYTDTYRLTHYLSPLEHRQMILQAGKLYKTDKKKDDFLSTFVYRVKPNGIYGFATSVVLIDIVRPGEPIWPDAEAGRYARIPSWKNQKIATPVIMFTGKHCSVSSVIAEDMATSNRLKHGHGNLLGFLMGNQETYITESAVCSNLREASEE